MEWSSMYMHPKTELIHKQLLGTWKHKFFFTADICMGWRTLVSLSTSLKPLDSCTAITTEPYNTSEVHNIHWNVITGVLNCCSQWYFINHLSSTLVVLLNNNTHKWNNIIFTIHKSTAKHERRQNLLWKICWLPNRCMLNMIYCSLEIIRC